MEDKVKKSPKKKPWRKILYEIQDYPDNYVDESFLEQLRKNVNTRVYNLSTLVYESGIVSQQLSSVCIFVSTFIYMNLNMVSASTVLTALIALATFGYMLSLALDITDAYEMLLHTGQDLKSVILFTSFVLGLSPLLKTLTKTISTDTIYAMTVCMLATNLLLHDYSAELPTASISPSLNACIFASVCLASRLPTPWHAFVTVMLAMLMFAVIPQIRIKLKNHKSIPFILLTILMGATAVAMVAIVSIGFALALLAAQLAISLLFPWWMVRLQRHKKKVHEEISDFEIRNSQNKRSASTLTKIGNLKKSFSYVGAKIRNDIPKDIKNVESTLQKTIENLHLGPVKLTHNNNKNLQRYPQI